MFIKNGRLLTRKRHKILKHHQKWTYLATTYLSRNFCNQVAFVGIFKGHPIWILTFHNNLHIYNKYKKSADRNFVQCLENLQQLYTEKKPRSEKIF